jgi:predicted permease
VAMTLVLVAVGSVFVDALISLRNAPLGVDVDHVLDMQLSALPGGYPNGAAPTTYYRTLVDRVQAIPGVASVSLSGEAPFATVARPVDVAAASPGAPIVSAEEKIITDRFFETMRIPLVAGQDFRPSDAERSDRTVIVSDSLARRLFGSDIALGRLIRIGTKPELQALRIVGVARDAVVSRPQARNTLIIYQNWWQAPIAFPTLVARTRVEPVTVAAAVRGELRQEGREFPTRVRTLEEAFDGSLAQERLLASLSGAFSILGLALAAVGLYGVLAFTVANRTNEIGVRMALGASRRGILRLIVNDALVMLGTGAAIGVPLAWLAVRMASRVLFDAHPSGVLPILSAVVLLVVIGVIAASAPALRASSLNPVDALRHD